MLPVSPRIDAAYPGSGGSAPFYRIATEIGVDGKIACHSLRKTWGYHAWVSNEVSPVVIMEIYNHSDFKVTQRYLGVTQDDINKAYLGMELI